MLRLSIISFILPAILSTVACGDPCLPTFLSDGTIIAAEDCTPAGTDSASTAAEGSDSVSETSNGSGSTGEGSSGGECPIGPGKQFCDGAPANGEMWGKCIADGTCNDGLACVADGVGQVCVPECGECGCPADQECGGGTCMGMLGSPKACVPSCLEDVECPVAGMFCASNFGACMWPNF